jgi:hypothetical protein
VYYSLTAVVCRARARDADAACGLDAGAAAAARRGEHLLQAGAASVVDILVDDNRENSPEVGHVYGARDVTSDRCAGVYGGLVKLKRTLRYIDGQRTNCRPVSLTSDDQDRRGSLSMRTKTLRMTL